MVREAVSAFFRKYRIPSGAGIAVAVSGGPDSMALLHALCGMDLQLAVLHCNFTLRGDESDGDEAFVRSWCSARNIPCHVRRFDTEAYASHHGLSIEMAARRLRYGWFEEMLQALDMDYIAVGHHGDDVAETCLINLCRGTGIRGLAGIREVNGPVLRPLLSCSRQDILDYLSAHGLAYRTDSTNASLDYIRNRIRHQIIPVCREINPSFLKTMQENCRNIRESGEIYLYGLQKLREEVLEQEGEEILVRTDRLLASPAPGTLLYEILHPLGFNKTQIRKILDNHESQPGKRFMAGDHVLEKGRGVWRLYTRKEEGTEVEITGCGIWRVRDKDYLFSLEAYGPGFRISRSPQDACLDAGRLKFPLELRGWKAGDSFCPLGMKGRRKKLSDFFADLKFTGKQKEECLLLCSQGEVAWVWGYRPDERFRVTPSTREVLTIRRIVPPEGSGDPLK